MANLPVILLNLDPYPHYTAEFYPNDLYRRYHPRQHHPIDMHTLGMISALAPHFRRLKANGLTRDDLAHVPSKDVIMNDEEHDFLTHIDVGLFAPEEITVKLVDDHIIVEGKHEEREGDDGSSVSRHFVRRYALPKVYNPDAIVSKLSSDGVLSVLLPKATDKPKERFITIQHTGPNDLFLSKNKSINSDKIKIQNEGDEVKEAKEEDKNEVKMAVKEKC